MILLVGKSGNVRGRAWPVRLEPTLLGRDAGCDICIDDPMISRRHCSVMLAPEGAQVEDLGSSNSTYVNGAPVKQSALAAGDEIAIGSAILLVSETPNDTIDPRASGEVPATYELQMGEPLYLYEDSEKLLAAGRPRTGEDLAFLFQLGRALSQGETVEGVVVALMQQAGERFAPQQLGVVVLGEQGSRAWYPQDAEESLKSTSRSWSVIARALEKPQGVLYPERRADDTHIHTTLFAPMVLGRDRVGGIYAQTATPQGMYEQSDLELLLCVAHTAAPYVRAAEHRETLERENERLVTNLPVSAAILGASEPIVRARELARQAARSDLSVLILGETGAGKELLSRMVHELSGRRDKPLVVVNCAAIPDELFESEVFGHERGAFTGAHAQRAGVLEEADGGTLMLDEIGDLSPQNQARVLRAIETGTFRRLGGKSDIHVHVRLISATNKNLAEEVEAGRFRRDLYHRLNPFEIRIPPLRQRREDIPALARHFLAGARQRFEGPAEDFTPESMEALQAYPWPGNTRQLRNVVERAAVVAGGRLILRDDLGLSPEPAAAAPGELAPFLTLAELEKRHIIEALKRYPANMKTAADALGIGRSTLYRKLQEYGLSQE